MLNSPFNPFFSSLSWMKETLNLCWWKIIENERNARQGREAGEVIVFNDVCSSFLINLFLPNLLKGTVRDYFLWMKLKVNLLYIYMDIQKNSFHFMKLVNSKHYTDI